MRVFVLFLCICSIPVLSAQQDPAAQQHPQAPREAGKLSADDAQALREDLARMKALVQQMESNLSFVDTSQSPLKHQFQLEIDMWRVMIANMERRLASAPR